MSEPTNVVIEEQAREASADLTATSSSTVTEEINKLTSIILKNIKNKTCRNFFAALITLVILVSSVFSLAQTIISSNNKNQGTENGSTSQPSSSPS